MRPSWLQDPASRDREHLGAPRPREGRNTDVGIEGRILLARRDNVALRRGMLGGGLRVLASRRLPTPAQSDELGEEGGLEIKEETRPPDRREGSGEGCADARRSL